MKKTIPLAASSLFLAFAVFLIGQKARPASLVDQWEEVEEATKKGLPKTAIEKLEALIERALKEKAHAVAIRAVAQKINLEGAIEGNKPEEKIARMEAEMAKAPKDLQPMMNAVLSNWYWQYFQRNRWRFAQRTRTAEAPGGDITTWDLPRILSEIDKQFQKTLAHHEILKKEGVKDYDFLLNPGSVPDSYRPTLYDFVVHDALRFYSAGEQGGSKAQDAFVLSADSPVFASAKDFMAWEIDSEDDESPKIKAIGLYQDLLRFHENDDVPDAFVEANLLRLRYGFNQSFGEEKKARYKAALKRFAQEWADHEMSARAMFRRAEVLRGEGELAEAHKLAKRGAAVFPDSVGGKECKNLINQIESKSSSVSTERIWNAPLPKIQLRYRNLTKAYFRIIPFDWVSRMKQSQRHPEYVDHRRKGEWLNKQPLKEWSVDLAPTDDFKERVEKIDAPRTGARFLFSCSHDPKFMNRRISELFELWVSDLSLVMRTRMDRVLWRVSS